MPSELPSSSSGAMTRHKDPSASTSCSGSATLFPSIAPAHPYAPARITKAADRSFARDKVHFNLEADRVHKAKGMGIMIIRSHQNIKGASRLVLALALAGGL